MVLLKCEHFGRYIFGRMMDKGISCSIQPSQAILIQLVHAAKDPMACEIAFDILHHILDTPFAFGILFSAHPDLKAAMPNVHRKFVSENEVAVIFTDEQRMILVINDFFRYSAVVGKGKLMRSEDILRYRWPVLPINEFLSGVGEHERDEPALDGIPSKVLHFRLSEVYLHLLPHWGIGNGFILPLLRLLGDAVQLSQHPDIVSHGAFSNFDFGMVFLQPIPYLRGREVGVFPQPLKDTLFIRV